MYTKRLGRWRRPSWRITTANTKKVKDNDSREKSSRAITTVSNHAGNVRRLMQTHKHDWGRHGVAEVC